MTRATLLHLLAHPAALNGPDVRALEELAQAFPYCQTAHLLLAKAAHDQGSMLAAHRLRRAATYAADRTRLRQLIEATDTLVATENVAVAATVESPATVASPLLAEVEDSIAALAAEEETIDYQYPALLEDTDDQTVLLAPLPALPLSQADEDELPAQAPPIRPPAEATAAQLEFGLATEAPGELLPYQLPELAEPEPATAPPSLELTTTPRLPAFSGVPDVCYAPGEGSRLGFCLVPTATSAAQLIPSERLPPVGEPFEPDALLLAHIAAHQLPSLPKPSSLDLINSFLQRTPVPTRRRLLPALGTTVAESQTDLSLRSTQVEPDLASENLAKILARQGKIERAIAVYERLMVKHPEKMAYFAAQIESLRPLA